MKIIENSILPFKGYKRITMLCFIFTRDKSRVTDTDIRHESIHWEQEKELLIVGFYLWYAFEFIIRLALTWNWHCAYRSVSFEQEAYDWEHAKAYPYVRIRFAWLHYLG